MDTRTTHLTSRKDYSWLDGGDFVSSWSRYYISMSNSKKYRYYYFLYQGLYDQFRADSYGDGYGGVGTQTTQFYPQKVNFFRDTYDVGFRPSQIHHTGYPTVIIN